MLFRTNLLQELTGSAEGEDPIEWLGAGPVLDILAPDADQTVQGTGMAPPPGATGPSEGDTAVGPAADTEETSAGSGEDDSADAGADSTGEGTTAETAEETAESLSRKAFREELDSVREQAKDLSRKNLTKAQKQYVRNWEAWHGRTFPLTAPLHPYNWKYLNYDENGVLQYEGDDDYTVRHGIDVSEFQGTIDWERVRKAGYDFAFIRAGYRMFETGDLYQDARAVKNLRQAAEAGLDVGVYVFSQAISKKEAREEADLCLKVIKKSGVEITLPVVFDPEIQIDYYARINYITAEQFTDNAVAFCKQVEKAGYTPAIYANSSTESDILDMSRLNDALIWYADYNMIPESPYRFTFWQYTDYGWVDGIPETETDLNLWFIKKPQETPAEGSGSEKETS